MDRRLSIYLRAHRLRSGLTQGEVAYILGFKSRSHVSRLERGTRQPTHDAASSLALLFGVGVEDLFPAISRRAADGVGTRAYELRQRLKDKSSKAAQAKIAFLEGVVKCATEKSSDAPTI